MGEDQKTGVILGGSRGQPGAPTPDPSSMPAALRRFLRPLAGLTAAYTGLLVFATHYPRPEDLLGPNPPSDKTLHFLAYGALGLLAAALLAVSGRWSPRRVAILAAGLAIFAAIDEATQPWFGRSAEPLDWAYDLIGLAAGIVAIVALKATLRSSRTRPGGPG
jgi:VanZ family protein